jgi:steroid delta-isomerase-like uncharacterized protein
MSIEDNKRVVRQFIDEVFVQGKTEAVDRLAAPDFFPHSWPSVEPGVDNLKRAVARVSAGLADVSMKIEDMIAEGDRVAVRLTAHAVHRGEFMGLPPTGKAYTISETHVFRVKDGRVVEHWRDADMLGLMRQLGALPAPARKG